MHVRVRVCVVCMVCAHRWAGFAALDPFRQLLLGNAPWSEAQLAIRSTVSHSGTVSHCGTVSHHRSCCSGTLVHLAVRSGQVQP